MKLPSSSTLSNTSLRFVSDSSESWASGVPRVVSPVHGVSNSLLSPKAREFTPYSSRRKARGDSVDSAHFSHASSQSIHEDVDRDWSPRSQQTTGNSFSFDTCDITKAASGDDDLIMELLGDDVKVPSDPLGM